MREQTQMALIQAIADYPAIVKAAITGSHARRSVDRFSDLDVLLVTPDAMDVSDVRALLSGHVSSLICAFHLSHYCTVLTDDFQKIDLAIFTLNDSPSMWVVHDYQIIKGGPDFEAQLSHAAKATRDQRAVHLGPDISMDNILLLLVTASHRAYRGELLSAHAFLAMAYDMVTALDARQHGTDDAADLLDLRRRLERLNPALAAIGHRSLFAEPGTGASHLARSLLTSYRAELTENQIKALDYLLGSQG
ncbi:MAG: nucleotidyltransferase domain-containing protein [Tepidisphaeraceae bacterium]|jgi:hypothetical protein